MVVIVKKPSHNIRYGWAFCLSRGDVTSCYFGNTRRQRGRQPAEPRTKHSTRYSARPTVRASTPTTQQPSVSPDCRQNLCNDKPSQQQPAEQFQRTFESFPSLIHRYVDGTAPHQLAPRYSCPHINVNRISTLYFMSSLQSLY